ncbi:cytochrome c peroxidase [Sinobacterium caligoides]|uniref:Methylamine utilization protein MauG n=1 Tax=Sinobacterium caligoides TaxID=933926 RepID=A0A3N2DYC1_9GAMM|nr:cytochrome c peroxidase [Sinobacterium caligoides]ROS04866.1 cytochrome c peroxidase [Sinobacterium caligoides]
MFRHLRYLIVGFSLAASALLALAFQAVLAADSTPAATPASTSVDALSLNDHCPAGFELTSVGCELRTLYQNYQSLENKGLGGLQIALPPGYRDGFSPQQIDLGRYLFFDPLLSANGKMSCATCHDPDQGFSDGMGRSLGGDGKLLQRSAPTLWNVAFLDKLFWDARADSLEEQAEEPLFDSHEMNNTPEGLLAALNNNEVYRRMFGEAYAEEEKLITLPQVLTAITAFQSTLISLNSRYDQYAHGYADALNEDEKAGLNVFRSFVARCGECHTPPLFTNQQMAVIGTPEPVGMPRDVGAEKVTGIKSQRGSFKVPSLRNIALTAPYMHSGRFATLREAVEFYTQGRGHAVPEGEHLNIHWHIWEPNLTDDELDRVVDFLQTLTDESFKPAVPALLPSGLPLAHGQYRR